ncbi:MAG: DUF1566 domain-containing protein [Deltaproteobacteria bacterium]|nr:DUF1566 domain-containing protein [Deltaproteobacteria bacterium]
MRGVNRMWTPVLVLIAALAGTSGGCDDEDPPSYGTTGTGGTTSVGGDGGTTSGTGGAGGVGGVGGQGGEGPNCNAWYDSATDLCWQNPADADVSGFMGAQSHCNGLTLGGYSNWRAPSIDELRSLVRGCPASETDGQCGVVDGSGMNDWDSQACSGCGHLAGPGTSGCYLDPALTGVCDDVGYWSSSGVVGATNQGWTVHFYDGVVISEDGNGVQYHVRCVRHPI